MFSSLRSSTKSRRKSQLCPGCDHEIVAADINIAQGVALCPGCGELIHLGEINTTGRTSEDVLARPPAGCRVDLMGRSATVHASLRSTTGFLSATAIALFWNGIVSIFTLLAIAGLWANFVGPVPEWFPAPGIEDGQPIMNGRPMGIGGTFFLCVFLTPFWGVGAATIGAMLLNSFGRVEATVRGPDSSVGTGVGPLLWRSRFDAERIDSVVLTSKPNRWNQDSESSVSNEAIELSGDTTVRFGSMLNANSREWMRVVLNEVLLKPRSAWRDSLLAGKGV